MLTKIPEEFRVSFLLQFTRELIKNSENEFLELERINEILELKRVSENAERGMYPTLNKKRKPIIIKKDIINPLPIIKTTRPVPSAMRTSRPQIPVLRIPEPRLPQNLQYLRPFPTKTEIDLKKLNPLIKDSFVSSIQCDGPDEPIIVRGKMGIKKTSIRLNKKEIDEIIAKFFETTKIPIHKGILKVVAGKLILSAIVSNVTDSKFIIKKMSYSSPPPIFSR